MLFLSPLDLNKNELRNARVQNLAVAPGTPVAGQVYFDTGSNVLLWHNGTSFVNSLDRANHTGTQAASTISDLASTVQGYRLDQFAVPTTALNLNGQRLTNIGSPTGATDAVNKGYVDALGSGLKDYKDSVRVATTGNISLTGAQTIDGVAVVAGDRVLVKAQTNGAENGLYIVAAGAWLRAADADTAVNFNTGAYMWVEEGATQSGAWVLTTSGAIVLGTTALTFAKFQGGVSYSADGTTLTLTGTTFAIAGTYAGQASITTLGTIGTGTWQGTAVAVAYGGTGATTAAGARTNLGATGKYAGDIGDGTSTAITVTHNLNSLDVVLSVVEKATGNAVMCDMKVATVDTATFTFGSAPAINAYRVVVVG